MGETKIKVLFKYERLINFCVYCGHLGHVDKTCDQRAADITTGKLKESLYGEWLRAADIYHPSPSSLSTASYPNNNIETNQPSPNPSNQSNSQPMESNNIPKSPNIPNSKHNQNLTNNQNLAQHPIPIEKLITTAEKDVHLQDAEPITQTRDMDTDNQSPPLVQQQLVSVCQETPSLIQSSQDITGMRKNWKRKMQSNTKTKAETNLKQSTGKRTISELWDFENRTKIPSQEWKKCPHLEPPMGPRYTRLEANRETAKEL
ncbi:nucleotidyltransferase family protein [Striga asiatica]|uniref:Nucleotidyltransferase family protein n=1 Tax=Striga asiatica TaxID=4170 RepID=A0A5A7Q6C3_STRAF|nr:nucleotidyltransferase family protein [Striga asiatica]